MLIVSICMEKSIKMKWVKAYVNWYNQWRSQNAENSYAHQREITGSSSDSLQLRPFSKLQLLLKERICSQRAVPYGMEIILPH